MVNKNNKKQILCKKCECTGCAACVASCLRKCIVLRPNYEGFLYPHIDHSACVSCMTCSKACPSLNYNKFKDDTFMRSESIFDGFECEELKYPIVYAAWNINSEIRKHSSSGGVFSALADYIIQQGGAVVGAALNVNMVVQHIVIDKVSEIYRLRGSKYVQSEVAPSLLIMIREMLEKGRQVLFTGTPCEILGLQYYLNKTYANLYCCDLVCHGVPSQMLFKKYVKDVELNGSKLIGISFRDKTKGWKEYGVLQVMQNGCRNYVSTSADPYMIAFLRDYALRQSCYDCRYKSIKRNSDLTIADFWGVSKKYPQYDSDDQGTSLVMVNNQKGKLLLNKCNQSLFMGSADLNTAIAGNPNLYCSVKKPSSRNKFYKDLNRLSFKQIIKKYKLDKDKSDGFMIYIKRTIIDGAAMININSKK